jgi:hypothetical protein
VGKLSLASTTASDMRVYTVGRRNLSVEANFDLNLDPPGAVDGGLLALMPLEDISDPKRAESASSLYLTKRPLIDATKK